ncbi:MAG: acyltransferase, partial [Bacteroidales bacterium]|nr:acyltransferase [Bacteroidales bacterium]
MTFTEEIREKIFRISSSDEFNAISLEIFHYQYHYNPIYRAFVDQLGIAASSVYSWEYIPFLPVSFFKTHRIVCGNAKPQVIFTSSGTSGMIPSRHEVTDLSLYEESFKKGFELLYGPVERQRLLALL